MDAGAGGVKDAKIESKPFAIGFGDGPSRCVFCGAAITSRRLGNGRTLMRHGDGEAVRIITFPDDYLSGTFPIGVWLQEVHQYERTAQEPTMKDQEIARLLAKIEGRTAPDLTDIQRLATIIRRQDARIAALEAARPAHGLPLEGTGRLPLERKGQ